MKRLKSAFFLLLCFALGIGLALAFQHLRAASKGTGSKDPDSPVGKGDAPALRGFSLPADAPLSTLDNMAALHATAVTIIYPADPAALERFVYHAHKRKLKVTLLPPPRPSADNPYPKPLAAIAGEAKRADVDALCISWLNTDPDPDYWQPQLAAVRAAYTGQIILAASPDLLPGIEFWDKVDLIGAIGPFDLPLRTGIHARTMALPDLRTAWACYIDSLESLAFRYGKRLVLLNVTVPPPRAAVTDDFPALVTEALVTETKGRSGTEGLFLPWPANAMQGAAPVATKLPPVVLRISELWTPSTAPAKAATETAPADDEMDETDTPP